MSTRPDNIRLLEDQLTVVFTIGEFDFGVVKITCPTPSQAEELCDMLREAETAVALEERP